MSPHGDVAKRSIPKFEELTGIKVGFEKSDNPFLERGPGDRGSVVPIRDLGRIVLIAYWT